MRSGWWLRSLGMLLILLAACARPAADTPTGAAGGSAPAAAPAKPAKPAAQQPAQGAARDNYFAGKTVTLSVNYSAGGPTDTFARLMAQHLEKHIPGRPNVIVENKPGAGGVVGMNHVYNVARKDGLTIGVFTPHYTGQVLGAEGVQFDESKFLHLGATTESQASVVGSSVGVRSMKDLPTATAEVVAGGLSPDSSKDLSIRTALNLLGVKYKYVTGYPGNSDFRAAFQRGEINFAEESLTGWFTAIVPWIQQGQAVPMGQRGTIKNGQIVRDSRLPDVPTYFEVAVEARGESVRQTVDYRALATIINTNAMSREVVYPPGVDSALVEVMRKAMLDLFADPEFLAGAEKVLGFQMEFMSGAEAHELAQRIINEGARDTEAVEYLKRLSRDQN
jgi:tripartite-type tricarboxylate transporter receptor subunit TctC